MPRAALARTEHRKRRVMAEAGSRVRVEPRAERREQLAGIRRGVGISVTRIAGRPAKKRSRQR